MHKPDFVPDRPIAFNREFVRIGAGITGALMLSQAVYWSKRTKSREGWFYKTQSEWEEETGLTRREQETARKRLVSAGVLEEKRQGIPCRMFFRVDMGVLSRAVYGQHTRLPDSDNQEWRNPPNSDVGKRHSNTETTAETTTESDGAPRKRGAILLSTYLEECEQQGTKPVPKDSAVFKYAEDVSLPPEYLSLAWKEFKDRNIANRKKYKSWPLAFLNCVRDNWYGLWWVSDDGEYRLTSKGKQADKAQGVLHD